MAVDKRKVSGADKRPTRKKSRGPKTHLELPLRGIDDDVVQGAGDMVDVNESEDDGQSKALKEASDFLLRMDEKQISKTNAEIKRLKRLESIQDREESKLGSSNDKKKPKEEVLPSDSDSGSTDMEGASIASSDESVDMYDKASETEGDPEDAYVKHFSVLAKRRLLDEEKEQKRMARKKLPVRRSNEWDSGDESEDPIEMSVDNKNARQSRAVHEPFEDENDGASISEESTGNFTSMPTRSTITTGARFGMQSPYTIVTCKKRSERLRLAREQIARLSTDIVNDPELTLGLIRRLSVFANKTVVSPDDSEKEAPVDDNIRGIAMLSMCAVFTDVLPGYRIRNLTEAEQKERVNQDLARRREWEQGLVIVYRNYLELCERESRRQSSLFSISIKVMCTLAIKAVHFNYRTNLLRSIVSCLSRRKWDDASEQCSKALIEVLKNDYQGDVSLEVVRLLNRMIKEKRFKVQGQVVDILTHLRLRDELKQGRRADTTNSSDSQNNDVYNKKLKSKDIRKGKGEHLSKKETKRRKELKEIQEEMKEAEAEVDSEAREAHQTETLKLLFVLYFSILKAPQVPEELLITTLRGLTLFAHRINIEFFRDLLSVLRVHINFNLNGDQKYQENGDSEQMPSSPTIALHCIVASLELLNGQGEALNLDLSDIVTNLYSVMIPLCGAVDLEKVSETNKQNDNSIAHLFVHALDLALISRPKHSVPLERLGSFIVRMCLCALHMPPRTSLALLEIVHVLLRRNEGLQSLVDNGEDRARNGHFDLLANSVDTLRPIQAGTVLWSLSILQHHAHADVSARAREIAICI